MSDNPDKSLIKREQVQSPEQVSMDEGREAVARRLGLTREHGEAYYRRGLDAYEKGDLENAILDLSEAIHYDRGHAEFYSTRGLFHLESSHDEEALLDLEYALKLSKRQWLAHYALGILDFRHGEYESAVKHFDEAQKRASHRPEVWFYRAVAHHYAGDDAKALADIQRAEKLFPSGDKRVKDVTAWIKELRNSIPAQPKSAGSPPPLRRSDSPQLEAPDESSESEGR